MSGESFRFLGGPKNCWAIEVKIPLHLIWEPRTIYNSTTRFQTTFQPYKIDPFRNTFCQTLPPENPWFSSLALNIVM